MELKYDANGLVPAIAQDRLTGEIRMVAWMNRKALAATLATRRATFFSRSRQRLWEKGESSGHGLTVHAVRTDCDADVILLEVTASGPSCHTGKATCFFQTVDEEGVHEGDGETSAPFLLLLERLIAARKQSTSEKSYTRALLDGGAAKIGKKLVEESFELAMALDHEPEDRVASEAADLVFHLLVGLSLRDQVLRNVVAELAARFGVGGHAEKAARAQSSGG